MKKQHYILPIVLLLASVFCRLRAEAQCSNYVNNASTTFSLPSEFTNGKSFSVTDEISVCAGLALSSTTVEVSAAGNLTNGSNSIALSKFTFLITGVTGTGLCGSGSASQITLSTSYQTVWALNCLLALGASPKLTPTYTISGGSDLLLPAGTYSTTLNVHIIGKNILGIIVSDNTVTGTLSVNINTTTQLTIDPSFGTTTMTFGSANDYNNGVSVSQSTALNAFSTQAYHITVIASQDLTYSTSTIPVSNINLTPAAVGGSGITTSTKSLSTSAQTIISATTGTLSQNFNLQYYTSAANTAFLTVPSGTYTTTVTYTISSP